jgi:membrane fusion protein, type I secretion system
VTGRDPASRRAEKIAQLEAQITGGQAQAKAYRAQLESVKKERDDIDPLVKRGLIAQPRYLQLERSGAGLEGQEADALANIAKSRQAIAEQMQQMAQLDYDRMTEVSKDLRDTQAKLLEVIPKLSNAKAVLGRMEIRTPYTGYVVALTAFSVGGVITKGDKILDVVPEQESLVIEAQIPVDDISEVHPNMRADVHLTAYKARITPVVRGTTTLVSADRLTDKRGDNPYSYYTALVSVDQSDLEALPNVRLYPGMPATVMFPTVERTAFNYVVGPLVMSFNRAFRHRVPSDVIQYRSLDGDTDETHGGHWCGVTHWKQQDQVPGFEYPPTLNHPGLHPSRFSTRCAILPPGLF